MTSDATDTSASGSLNILGVSESEECAYRFLLSQPGTTAEDMAHTMSLSLHETLRLLGTLESKGLVSHCPEQPRLYNAAAPEMVMEALLLRRQQELHRAKATIEKFKQSAAHSRQSEPRQIVELIASGEAERLAFEHMHLAAEREVLTLIRLPIRITACSDSGDFDIQRKAQARGVIYRNLVDSEFLAWPGAMAATIGDIRSGQLVRGLPSLPFKMVIADRRLAMIPLTPECESSRVLLVRESALLDALHNLFELLWERASPLKFGNTDTWQMDAAGRSLQPECARLIPFLVAGLNDKFIAQELDVSTRTLDRRICELMKGLDARTRFQAGWIAARRYDAASNEVQSQ